MSGHLWMFSHMLDDRDLVMAQHDFLLINKVRITMGLVLRCLHAYHMKLEQSTKSEEWSVSVMICLRAI